ncbi:MAG TPA: lysylphosphatidylglycerol synthase transmembrane domain-containing protein [Gemmatimonadaceae bacterium]|nr:lysylphosphatidylglycerol synthase transmembrane domain-containing protein [Gemmatimonadaceae bacterium]
MLKSGVARWLLVAASFTATLGISAYILWSGWAKSGAPPKIPVAAHALALAAVVAEILTRTIKIQWSAAALRIPLSFLAALRVCLGGDFGASITPSRSGAEPARFLVLAEAGVPAAGSILILFTELFLEMTSLCLLCALLAVAFHGSGEVVSLMIAMIGGYAAIVLSLGAFGYFLAHRGADGPPPPWARSLGLGDGRWRVVQRALHSLRSGIAALKSARLLPMGGAFVASMVHVSLRLAVLPIVALAMDPTLPVAKLVLWPLVFLYGGAVAPAPGGGGAVEFGFKFAFSGVMSPSVLGGALVWWRFYSFYLYVVLGALAAGSTVLRALRAKSHAQQADDAGRGTLTAPDTEPGQR